jgi:hypothetical protein
MPKFTKVAKLMSAILTCVVESEDGHKEFTNRNPPKKHYIAACSIAARQRSREGTCVAW